MKNPLVLKVTISVSNKYIGYDISEPEGLPIIGGNIETTEQHLPQNNIDNLLSDLHSSIRAIIKDRPKQ